jgi:hypothetical protein
MIIFVVGYFINVTMRFLFTEFLPKNVLGIIEKDVIIMAIVIVISLIVLKIFGGKKKNKNKSIPSHAV